MHGPYGKNGKDSPTRNSGGVPVAGKVSCDEFADLVGSLIESASASPEPTGACAQRPPLYESAKLEHEGRNVLGAIAAASVGAAAAAAAAAAADTAWLDRDGPRKRE